MSYQIIPKALIVGLGVVGLVCWGPGIWAKPSPSQISHLQIPILGTSVNTHHLPMGLVSQIIIDLFERRDQDGLQIQFHTEPGEFSLFARQSIHHVITRAFASCEPSCRLLDRSAQISLRGVDGLWRKSFSNGRLERGGHGQGRTTLGRPDLDRHYYRSGAYWGGGWIAAQNSGCLPSTLSTSVRSQCL